ncbi:MAG TPA: hypothetical protein PKK06_13825 [Phycisphaerae bacterium]|nr:hypothetical protein [Phycisphaerae bacterium]HNU46274.1 hypothetical protein [Phycisphaerae bacterium]
MKKFDCVKMKDEAQQRRAQVLRGMSIEQRLQFYRRADAALRRRREELRSGSADRTRPRST